MKVREFTKKLTIVPATMAVSEVAKLMEKVNTGSVVVESEGKYIGIVTERDMIRKVIAKGKEPKIVRSRDIMNSPLITINIDADVEDASRMMCEKKIRRLLVEENGKIVGKITQRKICNCIGYAISTRLINSMKHGDYSRPDMN